MSQDGKEEDTMANGRTDVDDGLLAELGAALAAADGPPAALVAAAKLSPDIVSLDEDYLTLVETEGLVGTTRSGDVRTFAFGSSGCRLQATVTDVGRASVDLEGRVTGVPAEEVLHETAGDTLVASVDGRGYFTLNRVPTGLGRLVVLAADGRRLPAAWVVF
jgi:hypothetical protein